MVSTKNCLRVTTLILLSTPFTALAQIQMLPPIQSGTVNTVCPSSSTNNFLTWDGASALKCQSGVVVDNAGRVGIGLPTGTAPTHSLDLEGEVASFPGIYIKPRNINRLLSLRWDNSGNLSELVTDGSNGFRIWTGGNERLRVLSSGDVGIGITSPAAKLDVSGGVKIGMDNAACSAAKAGTMRYSTGQVQVCNGSSWGNAFGGMTTYSRTNEGTVNMGSHKYCFLTRVQSAGWGSATSWYCDISLSGTDWILRSHFQRNSENMNGFCNCRATCID